MSDNVLIGLLVGLFIGGILGAMAMAVVATGSKQRFSRVVARLAETADASGQERSSSSRDDLLVDREEEPLRTEIPVAEGDDIDQEMRELVRRYERPSGS